jgi:hypothetical protein
LEAEAPTLAASRFERITEPAATITNQYQQLVTKIKQLPSGSIEIRKENRSLCEMIHLLK